MNHLIEQFLGQHNYCPLPGLGTLRVKENPAQIHLGENRVSAPSVSISLHSEETNSNEFLNYIATHKNADKASAEKMLRDYCGSLINLQESEKKFLSQTGDFYNDESGKIQFRQSESLSLFSPDINLVKVIHPEAVHQVRVGDTETTTARMTKYLHESKKVSVSKWGMALMILVLFILSAIVFYVNNPNKKLFNPADFNYYKTKTESGKHSKHPEK